MILSGSEGVELGLGMVWETSPRILGNGSKTVPAQRERRRAPRRFPTGSNGIRNGFRGGVLRVPRESQGVWPGLRGGFGMGRAGFETGPRGVREGSRGGSRRVRNGFRGGSKRVPRGFERGRFGVREFSENCNVLQKSPRNAEFFLLFPEILRETPQFPDFSENSEFSENYFSVFRLVSHAVGEFSENCQDFPVYPGILREFFFPFSAHSLGIFRELPSFPVVPDNSPRIHPAPFVRSRGIRGMFPRFSESRGGSRGVSAGFETGPKGVRDGSRGGSRRVPRGFETRAEEV